MKIALFVFESRDLNTYPSIVNTMQLLSEAGFEVDVFVPESMKTKLSFPKTKIHVVSSYQSTQYIQETVKAVLKEKYELAIAYFFEGLVVTAQLDMRHQVKLPTIYHSHEIIYHDLPDKFSEALSSPAKKGFYFLNKLISSTVSFKDTNKLLNYIQYQANTLKKAQLFTESWRYLEKEGARLVTFSIVQDKYRAIDLHDEMPFLPKKTFLVPNSYLGFNSKPSKWAHKTFGIPSSKKILLYTGGFERGFDLSLVELAENLPDEYVMILSVYSRDGYLEEVESRFKKLINSKKLFINKKNLNLKDYDLLVRSSQLGLVWRQKSSRSNRNSYWLGWSSGKLQMYLSRGKPVIAPSYVYKYNEFITNNGLGFAIKDTGEILSTLKKIETKYQNFSKQVGSFYKSKLEYRKQFQPVLKEIIKITS